MHYLDNYRDDPAPGSLLRLAESLNDPGGDPAPEEVTADRPMSQPVEEERVLAEAEALLDTDGRRERLDRVVAALQNGEVQPVGQAVARDRIEARICDARRLREFP